MDFAIFPLEVLMVDHYMCSSKEFARRFADREAFWINILKTLSPRGYNVRNDRPTHRQVNMLNNEVRRERKAAARTLLTKYWCWLTAHLYEQQTFTGVFPGSHHACGTGNTPMNAFCPEQRCRVLVLAHCIPL